MSTAVPTNVDHDGRSFILRNAFIVTCDPAWTCHLDGSIVVRDGGIEWIGDTEELPPSYRSLPVDDTARGRVVMPGLVNTHAHAGLSTHRGACDRGGLFDWAETLAPLTGSLTEAELTAGSSIAATSMVRSGVTCACDCARYGAGVFSDVATAVGMRSVSGAMANSPELRPNGSPNWPRLLDETKAAMARHADNPLTRFQLGAHSPYSCTPKLIAEIKEHARELGIGFNIHLAETRAEDELIRSKHGSSPAAWLDQIGVLDEQTLLDHCVWLDDNDLELVAHSGATVAHCPVSNAKLGSGVAPVPQLLGRGVPVGLGTDSMLSNNSQDLFAEMKAAVLLQRVRHLDGTIYSARQLLSMATIGGARALGWADQIGSLEVGKRADLLIVDAAHPRGLSEERVASDLVYATGPQQVRSVYVDGKGIYLDGKFTRLDTEAIPQLARQLHARTGGAHT